MIIFTLAKSFALRVYHPHYITALNKYAPVPPFSKEQLFQSEIFGYYFHFWYIWGQVECVHWIHILLRQLHTRVPITPQPTGNSSSPLAFLVRAHIDLGNFHQSKTHQMAKCCPDNLIRVPLTLLSLAIRPICQTTEGLDQRAWEWWNDDGCTLIMVIKIDVMISSSRTCLSKSLTMK